LSLGGPLPPPGAAIATALAINVNHITDLSVFDAISLSLNYQPQPHDGCNQSFGFGKRTCIEHAQRRPMSADRIEGESAAAGRASIRFDLAIHCTTVGSVATRWRPSCRFEHSRLPCPSIVIWLLH